MVRPYFAMSFGAFILWRTIDWIAPRQDEKKEQEEKEMQIKKMREQMPMEAKQNDSLA